MQNIVHGSDDDMSDGYLLCTAIRLQLYVRYRAASLYIIRKAVIAELNSTNAPTWGQDALNATTQLRMELLSAPIPAVKPTRTAFWNEK